MELYKLIERIEILSKKIDALNDLKEYWILDVDSKTGNFDNWLPRPIVMKFFGYGNTQMSAVAKRYDFISSKIGSKIFYHKDSIIKAIKNNRIT